MTFTFYALMPFVKQQELVKKGIWPAKTPAPIIIMMIIIIVTTAAIQMPPSREY